MYTRLKESTRDEQAFFIGALREKCIENKRFIDLKVQENDIPFRLETGAQCNVIPQIICEEKDFVVDSRRWSKLSRIQAMKSCEETKSRMNCVDGRMGTITTIEQPIKWLKPIFVVRKPHREMFVSALILLI